MGTRADQKERTREEILASAFQRLRTHGIGGASVAEVMKGAGLTVGGFYAHFDSKETLVGTSVREGLRRTWSALMAHAGQGGEALVPVVRRYLSATHRDHPEQGCVLPAVVSEAGGAGEPLRDAIAGELTAWADALGSHLDGAPGSRRQRALGALAMMVGGLALARAVRGTKLSDEILAACRERALVALRDG